MAVVRVCSGAGCLRAVADDVRYCDECKPVITTDDIHQHTNGYGADLDRLRKTQRWRLLRARVLRSQPLCARCHKALATIADHIIPAQIAVMQAQAYGKYVSQWEGYFLRSNIQGLCRPCHGLKTVEDKAHTGTWPDVCEQEQASVKRVYSF